MSATTLIYLNDAYVMTTEAVVIDVDADGRRAVLERTPLYPGGGGQPPDTGFLRTGDGDLTSVTGLRAEDDVLWHLLGDGPLPDIGDQVMVQVDRERRYMLMRTHTAMHVLCGVIWSDFQARVTGHNLGPGEGRCDFELPSVAGDFGSRVEERMNCEIAKELPVSVEYVSRGEAARDPALIRAKADLIPAHIDPLRVVTIAGVDRQADSGTHVRSTAEVGRVRVIKTESRGRANKRIRIALDDR